MYRVSLQCISILLTNRLIRKAAGLVFDREYLTIKRYQAGLKYHHFVWMSSIVKHIRGVSALMSLRSAISMLMLIPSSMERARPSLAIERLIEPREYLTILLASVAKHTPKKPF
jgi:hypothetical protein